MRTITVLLLSLLLAGCGQQVEQRPLVRSVGIGTVAGAATGTFLMGPGAGTGLGAVVGAGAGAVGGLAWENLPKTQAMATLPPQFDGAVAVPAPPPAPPPAPAVGYKPFGSY